MGLLDQLFRHKSDLPGAGSLPDAPAQGAELATKGLGMIAAAVGLQADRGMPAEFEIVLGDLLQRAPGKFLRSGSHDPSRILRVPAAEITGALAKGRAELPLARLIALAPDVFRSEPGDSGNLCIRLPLQKLLQQIGGTVSAPGSGPRSVVPPSPPAPSIFQISGTDGSSSVELGPLVAHLPSIPWEKIGTAADTAQTVPAVGLPVIEASAGTRELRAPGAFPVQPAPPVAHEVHPPLHAAAEEPGQKILELRPQSGVAISTTLRAVILGGSAVASQGGGIASANPILAPHAAAPSGSTPSIILAPTAAVRAADSSPPANQNAKARTDAGADAPVPRAAAPAAVGLGEGVNVAALQSLFMTDATLDLATVAARVATLPGIHACVVSFAGGSAQAGQFHDSLDADAVRAIAQNPDGSADESVSRTSVGAVSNTTLIRGDRAVAIFLRDRVALAVVLDARGFVAGVRERIGRATEYLAGGASAE